MSFRDGVAYPKDCIFTPVELGAIKPNEIVRWFQLKAYGVPDPPNDTNPTEGISNSLYFAKKALLFFMPNRMMICNILTNPPSDNPTRSLEVNKVIKDIKRKEVRHQKKDPNACSPFEVRERV